MNKNRLQSKELGIFLVLVLVCVVGSILNPRFLSSANLQNTARLVGMYGIFSIGLGFVIVTGGIDLSVGSVLALLGVLLSMMLVDAHWNPVVAVLATLALGLTLGGLHGLLITKMKMQPFIVTLCGLLLYRGIARFVSGDSTKGFGDAAGFEALRNLATGNVLGLPMPFVLFLVVAAVAFVALHKSVYGRYLLALGQNEEAARYAGIDTQKLICSVYILSGGLTALASILIAFDANSVSPSSHGNFYELYGIAAAVLGGCSLRGGEGSILGIVIGTILLRVLQNLVTLLGIPSSLDFAVTGTVILLGVLADQFFTQQRRRKTVG